MTMYQILGLIKSFESRNNISIAVTIFGDGSSSVEEFWDEEKLNESKTTLELHKFLRNTNYRLSEGGICFSPVVILIPKT